ncbi:MAG: diguanylate cyclase [Chloroflexi bacterium]|nr:diguanylate cyclase [Chloroflexota bacterium]
MPARKTSHSPGKSLPEGPAHEKGDLAALQEELKKVQAELARKSRFAEHILATLPNLTYIFDFQEKRIVFVNRISIPFLGYTAEKLLEMDGADLEGLLHPDDMEHVHAHYEAYHRVADGDVLELEFRLKHSYGDWHWVSIRETPYDRASDGQVFQVLGTAEDVTDRMLAQEKLWYTSTHDSLTGLYNRPYFEEELSRLERGRRFPVTVMAADVDGLREVNDRLGHPAGDALIRNAAEVIKSCFRAEDVVARTGGDEFSVLLPDIGSISIDAVQTRVLRRIETYNNAHPKSPVHISFGFATAERGEMLRDIVREADRRMESNKVATRNKNVDAHSRGPE